MGNSPQQTAALEITRLLSVGILSEIKSLFGANVFPSLRVCSARAKWMGFACAPATKMRNARLYRLRDAARVITVVAQPPNEARAAQRSLSAFSANA